MRRTASSVLRDLEIRVARLERSARPSMSPRRQIEEGLLDYEDHNPQINFEAFELNERSILRFVRENLVKENTSDPELTFKKVVAVSVDASNPYLVDIWVKVLFQPSLLTPDDEFHSYSFDATVTSKGNVIKTVPDEEHDLTYAQYSRLEKRPIDVSIDFDSLHRAFPNYLFKS